MEAGALGIRSSSQALSSGTHDDCLPNVPDSWRGRVHSLGFSRGTQISLVRVTGDPADELLVLLEPSLPPRLYCPRMGRALIAMLVSTMVAPLLEAKPCQSAARKACEPQEVQPEVGMTGKANKGDRQERTGAFPEVPASSQTQIPETSAAFQSLTSPQYTFPSYVVFKC